jgi:dTDP-4-amino-4,6-dideoxygalactose transaminase
MTELNSAHLYSQLIHSNKILKKRSLIWNKYQKELSKYSLKNKFEIQKMSKYSGKNFHIFFIKLKKSKRILLTTLVQKVLALRFITFLFILLLEGLNSEGFMAKINIHRKKV